MARSYEVLLRTRYPAVRLTRALDAPTEMAEEILDAWVPTAQFVEFQAFLQRDWPRLLAAEGLPPPVIVTHAVSS